MGNPFAGEGPGEAGLEAGGIGDGVVGKEDLSHQARVAGDLDLGLGPFGRAGKEPDSKARPDSLALKAASEMLELVTQEAVVEEAD